MQNAETNILEPESEPSPLNEIKTPLNCASKRKLFTQRRIDASPPWSSNPRVKRIRSFTKNFKNFDAANNFEFNSKRDFEDKEIIQENEYDESGCEVDYGVKSVYGYEEYNDFFLKKICKINGAVDLRRFVNFEKSLFKFMRFMNFDVVAEIPAICNVASERNYSAALPTGFNRVRSWIFEIASTEDFIFTLTKSGICAAFCRKTFEFLCFLNTDSTEAIRSLFINKVNNSLITVSVFKTDKNASLKCRSTSLQLIERNLPQSGFAIFETECFKWPGFVEFDEVNETILTFSAVTELYKVWDLKNYRLLYSFGDKNIQEAKISPGVVLLIYKQKELTSKSKRTQSRLTGNFVIPMKMMDMRTGEDLKKIEHRVKSKDSKMCFIEMFSEYLLIKEQGDPLQILNIKRNTVIRVPQTSFLTPNAFIFLYSKQMFLTFKDSKILVWNFYGELVSTFDDHSLFYAQDSSNKVCITSKQDVIISYCRGLDAVKQDHPGIDAVAGEEKQAGTLNVSDILTGKLLTKIDVSKVLVKGREISALHYNEATNQIYCGDTEGNLFVFSQ